MINEEQIKAMDETATSAAAVARPTDRQLLTTLAKALRVSDRQAHKWLYTFDFDGVSDQLIDEERGTAVVEDKPIDLTAHPFPLPKKLIDMGYTEEELEKDNPFNGSYNVAGVHMPQVLVTTEAGESTVEDHADGLPSSPESIVIYHGNCADGFAAALAFWLKYGNTMTYHAGVYSEPPPDVEGKIVYLVDFSYKKDVVIGMLEKASRIYFIDHHKTAIEDLTDLNYFGSDEYYENFSAYTDLDRSGAMLAWDFLHNTVFDSFGFPILAKAIEDPEYMTAPKLFHYVQDRDLWKKELSRTDEFSANLFSFEYDFATWASIMNEVDRPVGFTYFCEQGEAILRKQQKDITELLKVTKRTMWFDKVELYAPCASMPYTLSSEAGHQMMQDDSGATFAACYWDTATHRIFSLRSNNDGMDVSEIAKMYGGGGHRNAAGFRVSRDHTLACS